MFATVASHTYKNGDFPRRIDLAAYVHEAQIVELTPTASLLTMVLAPWL